MNDMQNAGKLRTQVATDFHMKNWGKGQFSVSTSEEAKTFVKKAKDWYACADVQEQIKSLTTKVHDWLIANKESTDQYGDPISAKGPWFDLSKMDYTDDFARLDLRRAAIRNHLYAHGQRRLLNLMAHKDTGLLHEDTYQLFDDASSFEMKALHEEWMGLFLKDKKQNRCLDLTRLRNHFLGKGTSPTKIRNKRLIVMAGLGLWSVDRDSSGHTAVDIGEVSILFHKNVFVPVLQRFESNSLNPNPNPNPIKEI
ncbi:hypothetical protein EYF88_17180 [Paracoccus sediminis]|uniref:Uncharacterized protein n=1 Tax=Paracoccus sediminis TaxID=1214787 RepID=A0A238YUK6_9RHOB|nr:hypothetical protein [Paracoccus sediminis]TBN45895.1 hypothetical protein EYF88_17180 [Paracoccus sediminis]SNR74263.1 hypothetical protein SAMN06265378_1268 [Paracoccus sediminis]